MRKSHESNADGVCGSRTRAGLFAFLINGGMSGSRSCLGLLFACSSRLRMGLFLTLVNRGGNSTSVMFFDGLTSKLLPHSKGLAWLLPHWNGLLLLLLSVWPEEPVLLPRLGELLRPLPLPRLMTLLCCCTGVGCC